MVDGTSTVNDWKAAAQEALVVVLQLNPLVGGFLGAAAPYVPIAIAVVNAFIAALPPPANAPPVPPAQLTRKAAEYRRRPR